MIIRPSTPNDISQIINLLKRSLGESLMPKSEAYWKWKHIDNPFGPSPILVAEEGGELIGVRAFLRWRWQKNGQVYEAIRAVDTATHPSYQGKGVFKKLTLELLKQCKNEGVDLVFNTPNLQSKPGYLKMAWEETGKLPVKVSIKRPFKVLFTKLTKQSETSFLALKEPTNFSLNKALENFNFNFSLQEHCNTAYSLQYLKWRYAQIPVIPYYASYTENACCIFRLKLGALGTELRICETFGEKKDIELLIKTIFIRCPFDYMSIEAFSDFKLPGFIKKIIAGPDVTIRSLAIRDLADFQHFNRWHPSLGDLEVF